MFERGLQSSSNESIICLINLISSASEETCVPFLYVVKEAEEKPAKDSSVFR